MFTTSIAALPLISVPCSCTVSREVVDGVFLSVSDTAGFLAECEQGVAHGFDGKAVILPSQVGPANAAFSPSAAGVAHARRAVEAYEVRAPRRLFMAAGGGAG